MKRYFLLSFQRKRESNNVTPHLLRGDKLFSNSAKSLRSCGATAAALGLLAMTGMPAHAQLGVIDTGQNADKPVDITADDLTLEPKKQIAVFKGNVVAKQGTFTLNANQMDVHYHEGASDATSPNALSKIVAKGGVVLTLPDRQAKSNLGVYDVDASKMELTGQVRLLKDKNTLEGDRFVYDVASGTSKLLSGNPEISSSPTGAPIVQSAPGGRVKGFFVPKQKAE